MKEISENLTTLAWDNIAPVSHEKQQQLHQGQDNYEFVGLDQDDSGCEVVIATTSNGKLAMTLLSLLDPLEISQLFGE